MRSTRPAAGPHAARASVSRPTRQPAVHPGECSKSRREQHSLVAVAEMRKQATGATRPSLLPMPGYAWPPALRIGSFDAMLNFDIADHPIYDGLELQWFDDAAHGTGMLAFLTRRDSHVVDYYRQRGLRLDPGDYQIGAGTGVWIETDFADALLEVSDDGVHAAALFTDADGRRIEVRVDDRDGRRRRRGGLLAPVSAAIEKPTSLFLVWLPAFDLVRTGGRSNTPHRS